MENMIKYYDPNGENTRHKQQEHFLMQNNFKGTKMIPIAFENDIFRLPRQYPSGQDDWEDDETDSLKFLPKESETLLSLFQRKEKSKNHVSELNRLVAEKDKIINKELFKKYFGFQGLIDMQKEWCKIKKHRQK